MGHGVRDMGKLFPANPPYKIFVHICFYYYFFYGSPAEILMTCPLYNFHASDCKCMLKLMIGIFERLSEITQYVGTLYRNVTSVGWKQHRPTECRNILYVDAFCTAQAVYLRGKRSKTGQFLIRLLWIMNGWGNLAQFTLLKYNSSKGYYYFFVLIFCLNQF